MLCSIVWHAIFDHNPNMNLLDDVAAKRNAILYCLNKSTVIKSQEVTISLLSVLVSLILSTMINSGITF